ncbi:MAG TPA: NfeD family protein [Actinopolymorphaceae bacterium]|nr:NfeD family protein [Actinopolymorphaceae bacterium]
MSNLLHWMGDNPWVVWVIAAGLLAAVEVLTINLVFIMLAAGAVAGALASLVGGGPVIAVIVAVVTAFAMLGVVRPVALRHLHRPPVIRTGISALVGKTGVVVQQVSTHAGTVKIGGEVWTARPYDERSTIAPGTTVEVLTIEGTTAYVHDAEKPWEL